MLCPVGFTTCSPATLPLFSLSTCSPALLLLRSNQTMCLFDLEYARSAANDGDLAGASSTSPTAPAVHVHDTHVCDTPRSPSTPYNDPTHSTRTLGEQNPDFFFVSACRTPCVHRVKGMALDRRSRDQWPPSNRPFWPLARALSRRWPVLGWPSPCAREIV